MSKTKNQTVAKNEPTAQTATESKGVDKAEQLKNELARFETKSGKIRYLAGKGWERGQIARFLGIKYQHVRNVLITPVTKAKEQTEA